MAAIVGGAVGGFVVLAAIVVSIGTILLLKYDDEGLF
jgi:hypothetical protein